MEISGAVTARTLALARAADLGGEDRDVVADPVSVPISPSSASIASWGERRGALRSRSIICATDSTLVGAWASVRPSV